MSKHNPILYLTLTGWQYAGKWRPLMVLYTLLFALSQSVSLAEPYVIGQLLNSVQSNLFLAGPAATDKLVHDDIFLLVVVLRDSVFHLGFSWTWSISRALRGLQHKSQLQIHSVQNAHRPAAAVAPRTPLGRQHR